MGSRTQDDEIVGCARAPEPEGARGPDVIELEAAEAVVPDPEPAEDAAPVTRPDRVADGGRDRIGPADLVISTADAVAPEHR